MAEFIIILVLLWLLGIINIPWLHIPNYTVSTIFGIPITLERLVIILGIIWLTSSLKSPFRQILWVFTVLWLLTTFGIITLGGNISLIILAIAIGLVMSLIQK